MINLILNNVFDWRKKVSEYKLKGVISEIKVERNKYQVKITGNTDYTVKYDKDEYNLLIQPKAPKTPTSLSEEVGKAIIISKNYFFEHELDDSLIHFIINCYTNHKPIEVIIKEGHKISITKPPKKLKKTSVIYYIIQSITVLAN